MKDVIALVDLDDTLFQTISKCPSEVPHHQLTPIGFGRDGDLISQAMSEIRGFALEQALAAKPPARSA